MTTAVGQTEVLSISQRAELDGLEAIIERGLETFVDVGKALLKIRDKRLYREHGETFDGYCRSRWGMSKTHANRLVESAQIIENLTPMGVNVLPENERQTRPLASLTPEDQRTAWQFAVDSAPNGKVTAEHIQRTVAAISKSANSIVECAACNRLYDGSALAECPYCTKSPDERIDGLKAAGNLSVHYSSDSPEWNTPRSVIDCVLDLWRRIDLDPCSNNRESPNVPAAEHFTAEDDGLSKEWRGLVYMNPPYGREIADWIEHLVSEFSAGRVKEAIALLPARTDTEWCRKLKAFPRCFVSGRLNFSQHENSAPFPSMVVYLGPKTKKFAESFAGLGDTYTLLA